VKNITLGFEPESSEFRASIFFINPIKYLFQGYQLVDENYLVLKDADAVTSNQYSVRLLDDTSKALNITYSILPIEHHMRPDQVPSTGIFPSKYRTFVRAPSSFRISYQLTNAAVRSPAFVIGNSFYIFFRDYYREDAATEITISCSPSSQG